ncbi:MAG: hypothetical protein WC462_01505 [archaeon]
MKATLKGLMLIILLILSVNALAANPEITQVSYNPSPAVPGATIIVLVQTENQDSIAYADVTLQVENQYPFTVKTTEGYPNPKNVGTIEGYGNALTQFIIYIDPTAENKTYYLPITITTKLNQTGKKINHPIVISGQNPVIKVISMSNDKFLPGQEKEITFTLQNVGTSPAYDIILEMQEDRTVTATGTVVERDITPLGAATAYISTINPGEKKETTLKISVTNTATIKNYTQPIQISYRDASGERTTETSYIGLKVFGTADLDVTLKEKTGYIAPSQTANITLELFNKGLGKAEFTLVELKINGGTIDKPKQFIGALGPNDVDTIKTDITFTAEEGERTIEVTINYQDSDSTMKTKTIQIPLKTQQAIAEGPNMLLILVILVVIGIIVWNFFIKKKKK